MSYMNETVKQRRARPGEGLEWCFNAVKIETDECLIWPFGRCYSKATEIGRVSLTEGQTKAHSPEYGPKRTDTVGRIVCEIAHGMPKDPSVISVNSCGNYLCGNKRHYYWGTFGDRGHEVVLKGRVPRGAEHPRTKLTEQDVRDIRELRTLGFSSSQLSQSYGVSCVTVRRIVTGRGRKYVAPTP